MSVTRTAVTRTAATLAALLLALTACGPPAAPPGPSGTPAPTPTGTAEPPAPSEGLGSGPGGGATVAVYYLGDEEIVTEASGPGLQPRLYREFHTTDVGDGSAQARVAAAVSLMFTPGSALDPDFRTGWPATAGVNAVTVSGSTATVDLTGAASHSVGSEAAQVAVQQLVWTATAVSGVDSVQLLLDGATVADLWGHVAVGAPLSREPALQTLALIWLISPQHDQSVGTTFEVHLYGAPFEATAQLRVRQGATVVHEQFVMLGGGGFPEFFGEAKLDLTLAPGTYTLEAYEISAFDGSEIRLDDKVVTVG